MTKPKRLTIGDLADQAKAKEAAGDCDGALATLLRLYQAAPAKDTALLYATSAVRMGSNDRATIERMAKKHPSAGMLKACLSEMALLDGDYETGFRLCQYRWLASQRQSNTQMIKTVEWDGQPFDGPLLVMGEQGLGEECMYASLLDRIPKAIVSADQRLHPILARSYPQHTFVHRDALRHYAHDGARKVEAMTLAGLLNARGNAQPWLKHDTAKTESMRQALRQAAQGRTIVGLSWWSARKGLSADKSIPAADLMPLLSDPRLFVVNLQYGDINDDAAVWTAAGHSINEIAGIDVTNDLDSLASLIMACDCVVSCSNTTAHIAGALGARTFTLVNGRRFVLWFWGREGDRTPWYPTMRILRGPPRVAWVDLVNQVRGMV
jgi:hypothetical protein